MLSYQDGFLVPFCADTKLTRFTFTLGLKKRHLVRVDDFICLATGGAAHRHSCDVKHVSIHRSLPDCLHCILFLLFTLQEDALLLLAFALLWFVFLRTGNGIIKDLINAEPALQHVKIEMC